MSRAALAPLSALALVGCEGGRTPIGDQWHFGMPIGLLVIAGGVLALVWREYMGGPVRRARRDARQDERGQPK